MPQNNHDRCHIVLESSLSSPTSLSGLEGNYGRERRRTGRESGRGRERGKETPSEDLKEITLERVGEGGRGGKRGKRESKRTRLDDHGAWGYYDGETRDWNVICRAGYVFRCRCEYL